MDHDIIDPCVFFDERVESARGPRRFHHFFLLIHHHYVGRYHIIRDGGLFNAPQLTPAATTTRGYPYKKRIILSSKTQIYTVVYV